MMMRKDSSFETIFHASPEVTVFAPGRVNLIGEHTDYNGGQVLPCALGLGIRCAASVREDRRLRLYSANFPDDGIVEAELDDLSRRNGWADYPLSVIRTLGAFGYRTERGCDLYFSGDLPDGAGLSSSAALEVAAVRAVGELFHLPVTGQVTALMGQFAENRIIGVNCGIMDQFASAMGKKNSALLLDTNTLAYEYVPLGDMAVVIVNSGVKHSLAASAYNDRRRECEAARSALKVPCLCALTPEEFGRREHWVTEDVCLRRARHVVSENRRVSDAVQALRQGDLRRFGELLKESHCSLRDDFEVSCGELDFLAETAWGIPGVYGARMTGGGFGGCTVNVMPPQTVRSFRETISAAYASRFGRVPEIYDGSGK